MIHKPRHTDLSMYSTWEIFVMPPFWAAFWRLFSLPLLLHIPRIMVDLASPILGPMGLLEEMAAPLLIVAQLQRVAATTAVDAAKVMNAFFIVFVF